MTTDHKRFPARLHVLIARDASTAVVIRRGPSKHVCFVHWDRRRDHFELAQWLYGRVYERRSDLSPDGRHMIYFAMNGKWGDTSKGSWTAISKAPWMRATVMYAKGNCWFGGGLFLDNSTYWLNNSFLSHTLLHDNTDLTFNRTYQPPEYYGGECVHVYYNRLQRDGWLLCKLSERLDGKHHLSVFEKALTRGWVLRKLAHEQVGSPEGKGCYWDEHELIDPQGKVRSLPDWEWADEVDGRLVWASQGCLYARRILNKRQLGAVTCLHDFNAMTFKRIQAPYV